MNTLLIFLIVASIVLFVLWAHKCPICGAFFKCECAVKMHKHYLQHMKRMCPCGCGGDPCRCPIDCVCNCPRKFFN